MFQTATEGKLVLALTGHRPDKLAGYNMQNEFYDRLRERLVRIIERSLEKYPIVECHSGMALGADTIWAEAIIECRQRYGDARVIFVADIPDYNQSSRWPPYSQQKWSDLMSYAEKTNTYNQNDGKSYGYVLNQRNIGMIDACDLLIAVYNGDKFGGTANAVKYGQSKNKYITHIHPKTI